MNKTKDLIVGAIGLILFLYLSVWFLLFLFGAYLVVLIPKLLMKIFPEDTFTSNPIFESTSVLAIGDFVEAAARKLVAEMFE